MAKSWTNCLLAPVKNALATHSGSAGRFNQKGNILSGEMEPMGIEPIAVQS
jgi:hypothetical protein